MRAYALHMRAYACICMHMSEEECVLPGIPWCVQSGILPWAWVTALGRDPWPGAILPMACGPWAVPHAHGKIPDWTHQGMPDSTHSSSEIPRHEKLNSLQSSMCTTTHISRMGISATLWARDRTTTPAMRNKGYTKNAPPEQSEQASPCSTRCPCSQEAHCMPKRPPPQRSGPPPKHKSSA